MSTLWSAQFASDAGGGILVLRFGSTALQVNAGATGNFINIIVAADRIGRLNLLSSAGTETLIEVKVDGVVVQAGSLSQTPGPAISFAIANGQSIALNSAPGIKPPVIGEKGQNITVSKVSGSTANTMLYNYDLLEAK